MVTVGKLSIFLFLFILFINPPQVTYQTNVPLSTDSLAKLNSIHFNDIFNTTTLTNVTFFHQNVLCNGVITVTQGLYIINSTFTFTNPTSGNPASGIILSDSAFLFINESLLTGNTTNDFFFINTSHNNNILINNSKISSSPNSSSETLNFSNAHSITIDHSYFSQSDSLLLLHNDNNVSVTNSIFHNSTIASIQATSIVNYNLSQNSFIVEDQFTQSVFQFDSISNLMLLDNVFTNAYLDDLSTSTKISNASPIYVTSFSNIQNLNVSSNTFQNFSYPSIFQNINDCFLLKNSLIGSTIGFYLVQPITSLRIFENNFSENIDAIYINDFVKVHLVNCSLNSFFNTVNPIYINQSNINQKYVDGRVNGNYYSNFKSIDYNNDGFYDKPYETVFFIDPHPLTFTGNNYFFYHNFIVINNNYGTTNLTKPASFHFFGFQWILIGVFYGFVCLVPIMLYLIKIRHDRKKLPRD